MSQGYFVKLMDMSFQPYLSSILWHSWTGMYEYLRSSRGSNLCECPRVNIGNAAVFGLKEDLHLGGVEYNVALTIFFVPYILCEIPSNLILKKLRPRVWRESPRFQGFFISDLLSFFMHVLIWFGNHSSRACSKLLWTTCYTFLPRSI